MQSFFRWFNSLSGRLIFFWLAGGLLPILLLGGTTAFISAYFVRLQATQLVSDIIHYRVLGVINQQAAVDSVSRHVTSDSRLMESLTETGVDNDISELKVNQLIEDNLSHYFSIEGLSSISIIMNDGRDYSLSTEVEIAEVDNQLFETQLKNCPNQVEHQICWPGVELNIDRDSRHDLLIPAISKFYRLNEDTMQEEPIGYLYMAFSASSYYRMLQRASVNENMDLIVVDKSDRIVFHPDNLLVGSPIDPELLPDVDGVAQEADIEGDAHVVISLTVPTSGWRFIMVVPEEHLYQGVYQILTVAFGLLIVSLISILSAGSNVRRRILRPLQALTYAMKQTQKSVSGYDTDFNELKEIRTLFYWYNKYVGMMESRERQAEELRTAYKQLQMTQEQLIESEKMAALGKLVAGVAHEINTPIGVSLTSISYSIELHEQLTKLFSENKIKRSDLENFLSKSQQGLEISANNLHRATQLVNTFKTVASDQHIEEVQPFSMAEYLSNTVTSLKPKTKEKNVTMRWKCPADILLKGYPGVLWQVLSNLVMNSLIHAFDKADSGGISIEVEDMGDSIQLTYADDGCGMDEEVCSSIFLPFFTTKRHSGGTGLGMHIVYNLVVQKLSGNIRCSSSPGCGTEFIICFPKNLSASR